MKALLTLGLCLMTVISFSKNKLWTCINEDGSTAFQIEAKYVYDFTEGLARVKTSTVVNNKWVTEIGFIDKTGKFVISPQYDKVKGRGFVEGRAWVKKKDDPYWTLIDKTGATIPTAKYDNVSYLFSNNYNLAGVYQNDHLGFIDVVTGKEVIACQYLGSTFFTDGLSCVTPYEGEKGYGFIDPSGAVVIPFQFKQAGTASFESNGMCRATVSGKTVLIDKKGKVVFKTSKGNIQGISNNWVQVFTKGDRTGWGYLNFKDEWVIDPIYGDLDDFNANGMAIAEMDGLSGIIDTNGTVILPFKYETIYFEPEEDGYIMGVYHTDEPQSLMNTPKDYFTANFEPIDLGDMKHVQPAHGGPMMLYTDQNNLKGYLNRDFEIVIKAKYSRANSFSDGLAWVIL